ncbi:MAG: M20/M25/M40 family metallo-hydrolase, partial [Spirochaetota bacterium]
MSRDVHASVERFARALRFPTVSARLHEEATRSAYTGFLDFIAGSYPHLFAAADVERDEPYRLVIELPGANPALDPLLLLAHYDVVDVEEGTEADWTHPPFAGTVDKEFIWGRGALDDKNSLVAALEASERVMVSGRRLERGLVLAFGGDEELMGTNGAAVTATRMREAGRRFHFALDEGAVVAVGMLSSPSKPIALVGIAEKGQLNVAISAETTGGHAAMPPARTALGKTAAAVARAERRPFPRRLTYTVGEFFRALAPHASFPLSLVYRFPRLFWPLLRVVLARSPQTAALIRTTQAATMAEAGAAPNVLPQGARAVVNVRILPGESVASVLARYRSILRREGVAVDVLDPDDAHEPVPGSPVEHPG